MPKIKQHICFVLLLTILTLCSCSQKGRVVHQAQDILIQNPQNWQESLPFSLTKWSNHCFSMLPEYAGQRKPLNDPLTPFPPSTLSYEIFKTTIMACIEQYKNSDFTNPQVWLHEKCPPKDGSLWDFHKSYEAYSTAYVQKLQIQPGSTICFMGDIHGSLHGLLRNLLRLVFMGFLDNNLQIIKNNFYLVFGGDNGSWGRYGPEVWYTLLQLKLLNRDNVFLLRGNHEEFDYGYNFAVHLKKHFQTMHAYNLMTHLYELLPSAVFIGNSKEYINYCHGGIEVQFCPEIFLTSDKKYSFIRESLYTPEELLYHTKHLIDPEEIQHNNCYAGFNWSVFWQSGTQGKIKFFNFRKMGYMADVSAILSYLGTHPNIKAFIRGHQHSYEGNDYGFKMFFNDSSLGILKFDFSSIKAFIKTMIKSVGPYYWRSIVSQADQDDPAGFLITRYIPVFTVISGPEGTGIPCDCFCLVTTNHDANHWRIKPCEFPIPKEQYQRKSYFSFYNEKTHTQDLYEAAYVTQQNKTFSYSLFSQDPVKV